MVPFLDPVLYNLYAYDIPKNNILKKLCSLTTYRSLKITVSRLLKYLDKIVDWLETWRNAINEYKPQVESHTTKRDLLSGSTDVQDKRIS